MKVALSVAETSNCRNLHGCVVVNGGRILAASSNRWRNNPANLGTLHVKTSATYHAEAMALKLAGNCEGATLYVARISRNNCTTMQSRPCDECYSQIIRSGIRRVVHT